MGKYILSGMIGFAIAFGCLLPPILHFVTGPLGPLIGGFAGGMKARAKLEGAVIIGLTMGACLAVLFITVGWVMLTYRLSLPGAMNNMIATDAMSMSKVLTFSLIPFSIAATLGTAGAYAGGKVMNK